MDCQRIEAQALVIHDYIDKAYRVKLAVLAQRQHQLERFYDTVQGELTQCFAERGMLLQVMKRALYLEVCRLLSADLSSCGARSTVAREQIVRALSVVINGNFFLEDC